MRKLIFLGLTIGLLASCQKDDLKSMIEPDGKSYFPLNIGNYWVYQHYEIDSLGNETALNRTDSVVIRRDEIFNNQRYFVLEGNNYPILDGKWMIIDYLRDSSGYLVSKNGHIHFSDNNFTDILSSKVVVFNDVEYYLLTYKMEKVTASVTVPAGEFEVLNYKGTVTTPKSIPGVKNPRYLNNLYSQNVGKVLETYFYLTNPKISEKRLVRYHIEKE